MEVYLLFSLESRFGGSAEVGLPAASCAAQAGADCITLQSQGLILDFVQEIDKADFNQSKAAQETGGSIGFFIEALARSVGSYLFRKHYPQIAKNGPGGGEPTKPQEITLSHLVGEYIEEKKPVDIQFMKEFWRISRDADFLPFASISVG